jgi:DNA repair protein RadC
MNRKPLTIHDMPDYEKPRERLIRHGPEALTNAELLALVLRTGTRRENVVATCQRLLGEFGDLNNLSRASREQLCQIDGIKNAKAAQLIAVFELMKRMENPQFHKQGHAVQKPDDAIAAIKADFTDAAKEHFFLICLNTRNRVINKKLVSVGNLDSSIVHPREVFKDAITSLAASVIFAHNHPSGDLEPSADDINLTRRLVEAGDLLGIQVLDHIIFSNKDHISLKSRNLI